MIAHESIYVVVGAQWMKIGRSTNPDKRIKAIQREMNKKQDLVIAVHVYPFGSLGHMAETKIIRKLKQQADCVCGNEWYSGISQETVLDVVKQAIAECNFEKEDESACYGSDLPVEPLTEEQKNIDKQKLVDAAGGVSALARLLNINKSAVSRWDKVPMLRAYELRELRPEWFK